MYLLIVDAVFLIIMELVLKNIPAPYTIFVRIGDLFVTLGVSFFASFIFYFIQVHMHKIKEKEHLYPSIAKMYGIIINTEWELLTSLLGIRKEELSEDKIREVVQRIDLSAEAPLIIGDPSGDHNANWIEYCIYKVKSIDKNWDMIMKLSTYLDGECMNILFRIQNTDLFLDNVRRLFPMYNGGKRQLVYHIPRPFINFWHFIEEQEDYYDRVFKPYLNGEKGSGA